MIECRDCGDLFDKPGGRGRPPVRCNKCRGVPTHQPEILEPQKKSNPEVYYRVVRGGSSSTVFTVNAPRDLVSREFPISGEECRCCRLKLPWELFPLVSGKRQTFQGCIGCKRECKGRKKCQLGTLI